MKKNLKHEPREYSAISHNGGIVLCDSKDGAFLVCRFAEDVERLKALLDSINIKKFVPVGSIKKTADPIDDYSLPINFNFILNIDGEPIELTAVITDVILNPNDFGNIYTGQACGWEGKYSVAFSTASHCYRFGPDIIKDVMKNISTIYNAEVSGVE